MAENNDGLAYLTALKQSSNTDAAAAAPARDLDSSAPSATANGNQHEQFKGADKRRSPRFRCEGSARIVEPGCEVATFVTFTDISMHGCYVEAQATYPVGTVLDLVLEAKDMKIEAKGTVKVNYPYLGMGIAFADMAEENKVRLKELLGSISRPIIIMGPGIASAVPARDLLKDVRLIADTAAAMQALVAFFEDRQMLMRDDFLRIVKQSQNSPSKK
jgi:PilZ domain